MGYLARTGDLSDANLRRAVVVGSAMGSFAVERFSNERLLALTPEDIDRADRRVSELVAFEGGTPLSPAVPRRRAREPRVARRRPGVTARLRAAKGSVGLPGGGVDIDAADDAKGRMRQLVESTFTPGVRGAFGGFGGLFRAPGDPSGALLVASADGVGTKVKVAIEAGRHDTVGHDLVNHCVNDILVQGASPLFFLDYVAFGKLEPRVVEAVVAGVAADVARTGAR